MEEWRRVPGMGVEVSSFGRVRDFETGRHRNINGLNSRGYRTVGVDGRTHTVHALVARAFIGPRPDGLLVRHLDDDKINNRPENLAYGTHVENRQDAIRNGRDGNLSKTHCPQNHELSGDNVRLYRGHRHCRTCDRDRHREKYWKKKES